MSEGVLSSFHLCVDESSFDLAKSLVSLVFLSLLLMGERVDGVGGGGGGLPRYSVSITWVRMLSNLRRCRKSVSKSWS